MKSQKPKLMLQRFRTLMQSLKSKSLPYKLGLLLLFLTTSVCSCAQVPSVPQQVVVTKTEKVSVPSWMTQPTQVTEPDYVFNDDTIEGLKVLRAAVQSCNADKLRISQWSGFNVVQPVLDGVLGARP